MPAFLDSMFMQNWAMGGELNTGRLIFYNVVASRSYTESKYIVNPAFLQQIQVGIQFALLHNNPTKLSPSDTVRI